MRQSLTVKLLSRQLERLLNFTSHVLWELRDTVINYTPQFLDELAETAQKQAQRAKTPPREFPKAAKRVNQEDGEIEDGELSD